MRQRRLQFTICLFIFLFCSILSCTKPAELPTIIGQFVRNGDKIGIPVELEITSDQKTRAKGLMYRREMAENHGMIFIFPKEAFRSFWMHNTYLPLDMLFLGADLKIQGILERVPILNDSPRNISGIKSQYVIELNSGFASKYGVKTGDSISFQSALPSALE